jgi:predicted nucleotidyltransferase
MDEYYRINEMEKSHVIFQLIKYFESKEEIVFSYLYGDYLHAHFFKNLNVGLFFNNDLIKENKRKSELKSYVTDLAELFPYPVDFTILNEAPFAIQFEAIKGTILSCTNEAKREKFMEEILKD